MLEQMSELINEKKLFPQMQVKDLIKILQKYDENSEVIFTDNKTEYKFITSTMLFPKNSDEMYVTLFGISPLDEYDYNGFEKGLFDKMERKMDKEKLKKLLCSVKASKD